MAVRPPVNEKLFERIEDRLNRLLGQIYLLWLLGIAIKALNLKPSEFTAEGVKYTLAHKEAIPGIVFLGCIGLYIAFSLRAIMVFFQAHYSPVRWRRTTIYLALRRYGRTFKNKSGQELVAIKSEAVKLYVFHLGLQFVVFILPLVQIVIFEIGSVFQALKVIFSFA
jgi:hypothetical protein